MCVHASVWEHWGTLYSSDRPNTVIVSTELKGGFMLHSGGKKRVEKNKVILVLNGFVEQVFLAYILSKINRYILYSWPCAATASIILNFSLNTIYVLSPLSPSLLQSDLKSLSYDYKFLLFSICLPSRAAGDNGFLSRAINIHGNPFGATGRWECSVQWQFGHVQHSRKYEATFM